ncbi:MAG: ABC transporter ATP-binding protein [Candidatus Protistobacter heckmanni]|nr:ABC transporter ATP-binding protein [Candidatus Protistobacter heckmanni]
MNAVSSAQASAQVHALTGMTPAQASPSPAPCIEVENLSVRFGALSVFDGLGFTVAQDEFVCLLGPSGCGKSTLLRAIVGLVQPAAGGVHVGGMTPGQDGGALRLGMMFQKPLLLPWRNTLQNVALPAEIALGGNAVSAADLARARRMLSLVRLEGFESAYPHQLSGGMQQRAALARALMSDPDVLLLDEPFGALDELTRDALNEELLAIWRNADTRLKTVVMVTHSLQEAVALSDRVLVFGARPARLCAEVDIALAHPRLPESAEFAARLGQVRRLVKEHA